MIITENRPQNWEYMQFENAVDILETYMSNIDQTELLIIPCVDLNFPVNGWLNNDPMAAPNWHW